jgi:hypothetical protein
MTELNLSFSGTKLNYGKLTREFPDEIEKALVAPGGILVLFDWKNLGNRNIFFFNKNLEEIWRIKELDIDLPFRPFTGISFSEEKYKAYNGSGWLCEIDFAAGEARRTTFTK